VYQHRDVSHLYKWKFSKRIVEVRVHRVDGDGRCVRQRVMMLVLQLRCIRRR
jgi:hypothetical protein